MKKKISLVWFRHPRPGIHYAHHRGRVILLHGFPKATRSGRGGVSFVHEREPIPAP